MVLEDKTVQISSYFGVALNIEYIFDGESYLL